MQPAAIMRALIFHEKFVWACAPFLSSSTARVIYVSQVPEVDVYISISFFCIQATGSIKDHFVSPIMGPRLIVFTDNGGLAQIILCAENEEIVEVPGETLHIMFLGWNTLKCAECYCFFSKTF